MPPRLALPLKALTKPQPRIASISRTQIRKAHGPTYDPPSGWLWGIPPGEKPKREAWEWPWYIGIFGSSIVASVIYSMAPDTSIQTWALEEARRRLEKEGVLTYEGEDSD